jgi:peptidyl-prolyl cis-trans isomerase SurA
VIAGRLALAAILLALTGCALPALPSLASLPSWVPLVGRAPAPPAGPAVAAPAPRTAPLLSGPATPAAPGGGEVVDRVVCVVNNDAVTQYELDEAEAYHLYENKLAGPPEGDARRALREQLLDRIIEGRLQLQQAERDKVTVEDPEIVEQLGELMKRFSVSTDAQLEEALKPQGVTLEGVKRRIRETLMVQKVVRRKVTLRVSVTEQEIDRYLVENRDKLETGLTFEARHILFLPEAGRGDDGWQSARRRADEGHARLLAGEDFGELARTQSEDPSGRDGGALGRLKRGELTAEIENAILALRPGESSAPFRSPVGYHLFKLDSRESLSGDGLTQARNQVRDILFREKYQSRLKDWLTDLRQRAMIDMRM